MHYILLILVFLIATQDRLSHTVDVILNLRRCYFKNVNNL